MGLRELLWLAIALLAVYVAVQLYRALKTGAAEPAKPQPGTAAASVSAGAAPAAEGFQFELETQQLRRDIAQLRAELGEQRKEIAELAARVRAQQEQREADASAKGASPEYDEALVFARRGLDVEAIAERCGITVAEAALVRALAQREAESGQRR